MASKKKTTKAPAVVSAKLPDGSTLELCAPTVEQWDRYLEKLRRGDVTLGHRELVQTVCISHSVSGETGRIPVLDRHPALIKGLADGLDDYAGGEIEPEIDHTDATVTAEGCVFNGPDIDAWESLQEAMRDQRKKYGPTMRAFLAKSAESASAADALMADKPALVGPLVAALGQVAGTEIKVEVKKG